MSRVPADPASGLDPTVGPRFPAARPRASCDPASAAAVARGVGIDTHPIAAVTAGPGCATAGPSGRIV